MARKKKLPKRSRKGRRQKYIKGLQAWNSDVKQ